MGQPTVGSLKVSFFGPFYGVQHIVALDHKQHSWMVISGPNAIICGFWPGPGNCRPPCWNR
ncbi:MAG: hypothetical protein LAE24_04335 [Candidatus Contendobacter sp.]|nr:hypothetical protein [Candidatus Contendobacter sp.]